MSNRWKVTSLDVWGNQDDGFDINQWFSAGTSESADGSDAAIVAGLVGSGYLKPTAIGRVGVCDLGDDATTVEVFDAETGEPLYHLTLVSEDS